MTVTTFSWLHLSDLHLKESIASPDRDRFAQMLGSIADTRYREMINPDVIFFTGDIAFSALPKQYEQATGYFDRILDACGLTGRRDRLLIVPGNHDVDRSQIPKGLHKRWAKGLVDDDENNPTPYGAIEEFFRFETERTVFVVPKFANFAKFIEGYSPASLIGVGSGRFHYVTTIEKEKQRIVVIGLNSAWLSNEDNEQGRLLLGEAQVCDALEEAEDKYPDARLRIALMHHPLYWLAEKDIHRTQPRLAKRCDLLLRGHLHCPSFSVQASPDAHYREFAAGASLKAHYQAYNLAQVDLDSGEGVAAVMLQHPDLGTAWGKDAFTYGSTPDGKIRFSTRKALIPGP